MLALRSFMLAFMLALAISSAHADDSPITFVRSVKSAPKGADVFFGMQRDLDPKKKITIVVYFHGLRGDEKFEEVLARQRIAQQVSDAGVNAIVVAPLMAYPIKKKSAKPFAVKGAFKKFLNDSVVEIATAYNLPLKTLSDSRVVLVGYSAGHWPMRMVMSHSDVELDGIVLLDAHYGSQDVFVRSATRIAKSGTGFFVTARSHIQDKRGGQFEDALTENRVSFVRQLPSGRLLPGLIVVLRVDGALRHRDFVTSAWTADPITDILKKAYVNLD